MFPVRKTKYRELSSLSSLIQELQQPHSQLNEAQETWPYCKVWQFGIFGIFVSTNHCIISSSILTLTKISLCYKQVLFNLIVVCFYLI